MSKNNNFDYDESSENYQDPDEYEDKDETMPELQQEDTRNKSIYKGAAMHEQKTKVPLRVETTRERYESTILRYDTLRKKYDIRNSTKKSRR